MATNHADFIRQLAGLAARSPDAYLVVGPDGTIEFANTSAGVLFELDPAQIRGTSISRWVPELRSRMDRPLGGYETDAHTSQNDRIPVQATLTPLDDGAGRAWVTLQDISRRRGLEGSIRRHAEELEKSIRAKSRAFDELHQRSRNLYDSAPLLDFEIDSQGAIASTNRQAFIALGIPAEKLIGVAITSLVAPEHLEVFRSSVQAFREGSRKPFESRMKAADGSLIDVLFHGLPPESGMKGTLRLMGLDITARREAERLVDQSLELAETQRARMERMIRGVGEGIVVTDPDGQVRLMNGIAESMLRIEERWAFGRDLFSDQSDARFVEEWSSFCSGDIDRVATRLHLDEPSPKTLHVTLSRIRTQEGRPAGTVAVFWDITQAQRVEEWKRELVANVAHELRSPLASVKNTMGSILRGHRMTPEEARRSLGIVELEAERLLHLVEDVQSFARLQAEHETEKRRVADFDEVLGDVLGVYIPLAQERNSQIEVEREGLDGKEYFDPEGIRRVLDALVERAVRQASLGSSILVRVRRADAQLTVEVTEPPRASNAVDVDGLYDRYDAGTADSRGTGLELLLAKQLVRVHGGTISAALTENGTLTHRFTIPIEAPEKQMGTTAAAGAACELGGGGLFADALIDDPDEDFVASGLDDDDDDSGSPF